MSGDKSGRQINKNIMNEQLNKVLHIIGCKIQAYLSDWISVYGCEYMFK